MNDLYNYLEENPIIAAIRKDEDVEKAINSVSNIIFILHGNISNIKDMVFKCKDSGKLVFIHIDLIQGLSRDIYALEFLKNHVHPNGIITTKSNLIPKAKEMGFISIFRVFLVDSMALKSGIKSIKQNKPHAIEVLPAVSGRYIESICKETDIPFILGGLISEKNEIIESLGNGALGVSIGDSSLWNI